jgi:hypothetical protein
MELVSQYSFWKLRVCPTSFGIVRLRSEQLAEISGALRDVDM